MTTELTTYNDLKIFLDSLSPEQLNQKIHLSCDFDQQQITSAEVLDDDLLQHKGVDTEFGYEAELKGEYAWAGEQFDRANFKLLLPKGFVQLIAEL
jgi:hypothetical protein